MKKDKAEKKAEKEEKKAKKKAKKAEKKAKKAERKAKKAEAKAGKKGKTKGKGEGGGKPKSKKKLMVAAVLLIVIAVAAVLKFRGGDGGAEDVSVNPPVEYALGETKLPALPVLSEEVSVYLEAVSETSDEADKASEDSEDTEDGAEAAEEEMGEASEEEAAEETAEEASTAVTYRYEGLSDPRSMIVSYANLLSLEDVGFVYVDEAMLETSAPDFEAEEGVAHLVQSASEEGMLYSVQLRWGPEKCAVTVDYSEGAIAEPPPPEPVEAMTTTEALDYFTSLPPEYLGLEGESMDSYRIYSLDGVVLVDGHPCIHMNVYSVDEVLSTNEIAGEYFLTADKAHLYKRDASGILTEIGGG